MGSSSFPSPFPPFSDGTESSPPSSPGSDGGWFVLLVDDVDPLSLPLLVSLSPPDSLPSEVEPEESAVSEEESDESDRGIGGARRGE